jgi:hypothetical protein
LGKSIAPRRGAVAGRRPPASRHYLVEHDNPRSALDTASASYRFPHRLSF